ncbi:MAG: PAS domain S-box protein [Nitrospira sp.]|nr:PAS domain S-box protein [Nitrospira sp.]
MSKAAGGFTKGPEFRRQEEKPLRATQLDVLSMPITEVQQLVYELQDHEVELEMQNEKLRRAQSEIERVRDRYVELYDFAPAAHLTLDTHCVIVEANLRAGTLLDTKRKELIGQPLARFFASEDQDLFHRHCQQVLTGTRQSCEVRLRDKASATSWVQLESFPIHDESGPTSRWRTALLDITERKRDEQAKSLLIKNLSRSQQHFQTLFNWTPSAVGISTVAEGRFLDVNDAFSRLTGYKREEMIGRTTVELGLWADPSERATVIRELQEQGSLHNREGLLRTKSGEIRALMVSVDSIQFEATPCLIYLAHDITKRKKAEEALRKSEERFRTLSEAVPAMVWICRPDGYVLHFNQRWIEYTGQTEKQYQGYGWADTMHPEDRPRILAHWKRCTDTGELYEGEGRYRRRDGQYRWHYFRAVPLRDDGRIVAWYGTSLDIHEKKSAENALRESEERYRFATRATHDVIWDWDMVKDKVVCSEALQTVFGYPLEEVGAAMCDAFEWWTARIHPEDRERVCQSFEQATDRGSEEWYEEYRFLRADGTYAEVEDAAFIVYDAEDKPIRMTSAMSDVTERKRTEAALVASKTRFRAIFDQTFQFIGLMKTDGTVIEANRSALQFAGIREEDVLGKLFWDTPWWRHSPDLQNKLREAVRQASGGAMVRFEATHPNPTGELAHIDFSLKPVRDEHGNVTLLIPEGRDITERKLVEEALRKSEERYRSIFENAIEGIFQTTPDGKYVAVNPALARIYGYDSPDDMIATVTNLAGHLYVDPGRRDEFIRLMQEQERVTGFEVLVYRKDGNWIWVSEGARALHDPAGALAGYEGTVEDVTERKLGEARLRATLEELRMLSERLATVREEEQTRIARELHDELGVGLTCLKVDLSRLRTIMGEPPGARARKKMEDKIRSMVEQVDATVASVQRIATELRPSILDDLGLVAAIEWQCLDFQQRTGIPCTCVSSADDIAMEPEQATSLFRICQEALTNTTRHAQATAIQVLIRQLDDNLLLAIQDDGVGIPPEKLTESTSLGLLGMRERAASLGGEVTIVGLPGKGTTVTVRVPLSSTA